MQIFVKYDKTYSFDVTPNTTIKNLKNMIYHKIHIPPVHQALTFYAKAVIDSKTMINHNIQPYSTLYLSGKLFSCNCCNNN